MRETERRKFIRQAEAVALLDALEDDRTKDIAGMLLSALWRQSRGEEAPMSDFDLELFMRVAIDFGSKHDMIQSVLSGEPIGKWPE